MNEPCILPGAGNVLNSICWVNERKSIWKVKVEWIKFECRRLSIKVLLNEWIDDEVHAQRAGPRSTVVFHWCQKEVNLWVITQGRDRGVSKAENFNKCSFGSPSPSAETGTWKSECFAVDRFVLQQRQASKGLRSVIWVWQWRYPGWLTS